jgi:hypothetical protein
MIKYLLGCFTLLLFAVSVTAQQKIDFKKKGSPLPNFYLQRTDGGYLIPGHLKKGKPIMVMIFSPECEHCGHVTDSLKQMRTLFKNTQIVMVAEERNKHLMKGFVEHEALKNDPLFKNIGVDNNLIIALYTNEILPQLIFYDAHHKLVKIFDGQYKLEEVKPYIK